MVYYDTSSLTQYISAQSSLPDIISDFLEAMARCTGWSFMVLGGGPDVAKDGNIQTISLHTRKDMYAQTFPKVIPNYINTILSPYSKFLESVYCESPTFPDDFALKRINVAQSI